MSTFDNRPVSASQVGAEMNDDEFLDYCETHAASPRCGFTPCQIARLMRMSNMKESAATYDAMKPAVLECNPKTIIEMVEWARQNRVKP